MCAATVLLVSLVAWGVARAATYEQQLAKITHGQPRAVHHFIQRRAECNHWAGEEGCDAARRKEINQAVAYLRCTALDRDEKVLPQRCRRHPAEIKLKQTVARRPKILFSKA